MKYFSKYFSKCFSKYSLLLVTLTSCSSAWPSVCKTSITGRTVCECTNAITFKPVMESGRVKTTIDCNGELLPLTISSNKIKLVHAKLPENATPVSK